MAQAKRMRFVVARNTDDEIAEESERKRRSPANSVIVVNCNRMPPNQIQTMAERLFRDGPDVALLHVRGDPTLFFAHVPPGKLVRRRIDELYVDSAESYGALDGLCRVLRDNACIRSIRVLKWLNHNDVYLAARLDETLRTLTARGLRVYDTDNRISRIVTRIGAPTLLSERKRQSSCGFFLVTSIGSKKNQGGCFQSCYFYHPPHIFLRGTKSNIFFCLFST